MAIISTESGAVPIKKGERAHVRFLDTYKWVKIASPSRNHVHLSFHYTQISRSKRISSRSTRAPSIFPRHTTSSNPPLPPPKKASPLGQINIPSRPTLFVPWFHDLWIPSIDSSRGESIGFSWLDGNFDRISNRSIDPNCRGRDVDVATQKPINPETWKFRFELDTLSYLPLLAEFRGEISSGREKAGLLFFWKSREREKGKGCNNFNKSNDSDIIVLYAMQFVIWWKLY